MYQLVGKLEGSFSSQFLPINFKIPIYRKNKYESIISKKKSGINTC